MRRTLAVLGLLLGIGAALPGAAGAVTASPRIIGGQTASAAAWPFAAALETDFGRQFCGGSLIAPTWVLTAGHCRIYAASVVRVVTGDPNLRGTTVQLSRISQAIRHPRWRMEVQGAPSADLMLLRLAAASTAPPIALPADAASPPAGTLLSVAGWGSTRYNRSDDSFGPDTPVLRAVRVRVKSAAACEKAYGAGVFIPADMLCASLPGQDACAGDSGGPLVQGEGTAAVLIGVVSWGTGCALPRYPGVYSAVGANLCWIRSTIGPPDAPNAVALAPEDGAAVVEWAWSKPCADAPAPSGFVVQVAETGQTIDVAGSERRTVLTGLPNGAPVTVSVTARNRNGTSTPITGAVTPAPTQATIVRADWTGYRTATALVELAPHALPLRWRVEAGPDLRFVPQAWQDAPPSDVPQRVEVAVDGLSSSVAPDLRVAVEGGTVSRSVELETPVRPEPIRTPVVRGSAVVGRTLSCDLGRWTGTRPFTIDRQWLRGAVAVAGATARLHVVVDADRGRALRCRITVSGPGGLTRVRTEPVRVAN